ncbi:VOC family protein [Streptomyces sp. NPDC054945]
MTIGSPVLRRRADDLESAVALPQEPTGDPAPRFASAGSNPAAPGPFLLLGGPAEEEGPDRFAGVAAGAEVIAAPAVTPNGRRTILRLPVGGVLEYVGP